MSLGGGGCCRTDSIISSAHSKASCKVCSIVVKKPGPLKKHKTCWRREVEITEVLVTVLQNSTTLHKSIQPKFNMDSKKPTSRGRGGRLHLLHCIFGAQARAKAAWAVPGDLNLTAKTSQTEPRATSKRLQVSKNTLTLGGQCLCAGRYCSGLEVATRG